MNAETFTTLAQSFNETIEQPHFEKTSFRVNKKIFATLDVEKLKVGLKLSPIDQSVFCDFKPEYIFPATDAWGKQGWTIFDIKHLQDEMIQDALTLSYCNVAPKKLAELYKI
ncbi:hypothetical protein DHW03_04790 [Pedobacter yonginense]|uniref:MmcQ/YjbR family DNA-binding protein n=1 Tax=Pedobacter yonginense TaxID=651869 RepID=A0A317EVB0_9SPHI|nr:MmcQ/YjbR family DNA-binding protein [Pedobacter yonginense]PWS29146.1 hypothetical protein DHW03_04790 [Pedobacter yonginense]